MSSVVEIEIPEWFEYDELVTLSTVVSEQSNTIGFLLAGDNLDKSRPYDPVVRIYLITLQNEKYEFTKEISAVSFKSKQDAINFATRFSNYSAIDLFVDLYKNEFNMVL